MRRLSFVLVDVINKALQIVKARVATVKLNLKGKKTGNGKVLLTQQDVTQFILDEAKLGLVPFSAFGVVLSLCVVHLVFSFDKLGCEFG